MELNLQGERSDLIGFDLPQSVNNAKPSKIRYSKVVYARKFNDVPTPREVYLMRHGLYRII